LPDDLRASARLRVDAQGGFAERRLIRVGNYELTGNHFQWVGDFEIASEARPEWAIVVERLTWGRFYGVPAAFSMHGEIKATEPARVWELFREHHAEVRERWEERRRLETIDIGRVNRE